MCLEHPDFQKLPRKSGEDVWGILPPFAMLRELQSQQTFVLLPGDLCTSTCRAFRVPPPAVTGPLRGEPAVYSGEQGCGSVEWGLDIWVLMVTCDLLR